MILPENSLACALTVSQRVGVSQGDRSKWREKQAAIRSEHIVVGDFVQLADDGCLVHPVVIVGASLPIPNSR